MNEKKSELIDINNTINQLQLKDLENKIDSLKEEINSIKEINSKTTDYLLLELQSKLDEFEFRQKKLLFENKEKPNLKLDEENEILKNQISDTEELTSTKNEKEIEEFGNETAKKLSLKDNIIQENQTKISELSSDISRLNNENMRIKEVLVDMENMNRSLIVKVKEKDITIEKLTAKTNKLNEEILNLQTEYDLVVKKDTTIEKLTAKTNKLNEEILNLQTEYDLAVNEKLKTEITLKNATSELNNLTGKLSDLKSEMNQKENRIFKLESELNEKIEE